ncbi:MAG: hypothetical protein AAF618_13430, partial [Pseudomonadota bacterium]
GQDGGFSPAGTADMAPGTVTAFYMASRQAAKIEAELLAKGAPRDTDVAIVVNASRPDEAAHKTRLDHLASTVRSAGIRGSAIILVTWPERAASAQLAPALTA